MARGVGHGSDQNNSLSDQSPRAHALGDLLPPLDERLIGRHLHAVCGPLGDPAFDIAGHHAGFVFVPNRVDSLCYIFIRGCTMASGCAAMGWHATRGNANNMSIPIKINNQ